jgi:hypothetical protein
VYGYSLGPFSDVPEQSIFCAQVFRAHLRPAQASQQPAGRRAWPSGMILASFSKVYGKAGLPPLTALKNTK